MRFKRFWCAMLLTLGGLGGCATWQTPTADLAARVPTLEVGQAKPTGSEYILLLRAGQVCPVKLTVGGSLLAHEAATQTAVKLRRDLYLYKAWASFDGKTWQRSASLFDIGVALGLDPAGGTVAIKVDQRP